MDFEKRFHRISRELEDLSKKIEVIMPRAIVREATSFGNSSHVVLSKDHLNKKIGIVILGDEEIKLTGKTIRR